MLRPSTPGVLKTLRTTINEPDTSSAELKFIADLGRSLLFTVHPKKVASKVAEAVRIGVGCDVCAFVVQLGNIGLISCAYDRSGQIASTFLDRERFERWLDFLPPQIGYVSENSDAFLVAGSHHVAEYVS